MLRISCKNRELSQKLAESIPVVISAQLDELVRRTNEVNGFVRYTLTEKAETK